MKAFVFKPPKFSKITTLRGFRQISRFYLRKMLCLRQIRHFEKSLNEDLVLKSFFEGREIAAYNAIRRFCNKALSADERVKLLLFDVKKGLEIIKFYPQKKSIFQKIFKTELSGGGFENTKFELLFGASLSVEEGFWGFHLKLNESIVYTLSFCFTPQNELFIARVQGLIKDSNQALQVNKILTKQNFGLRPSALLIECAKILSEILALKATLGVSEKYQVRYGKSKKRGYLVDYKKIWLENGGKFSPEKKCYILSHARKDLEKISSQKRSMYKKRFAMLDEIRTKLSEILKQV